MEIKVRYENTVTILEVPEEDFITMIDVDYRTRLATTENKEVVKRRTPQEIMDEQFNKPDYNNWHKSDRHRGQPKTPYCKDDEAEEETDVMDNFADWSDIKKLDKQFEYEALCQKIRQALKPDYANMIIAIHINGLEVQEYAALIKDKPNNVSHRLQRAEKILKEIFEKRPF